MAEKFIDTKFPSWVSDFKIQAIIIAVLCFVFYGNTFQNECAFDDANVITRNDYVLEGTAGLHDIFTGDSYESYYKQFNSDNQLTGGRYRPLSIASFAIEQQLLGPVPIEDVDSVARHDLSYANRSPYEQKLVQDMHVRHVLNVLWFTLSVIVLLYFLRHIVLKNKPVIAFLAVIIFTILPVHTEVVANVKSCDEIFSLLFICLTFIFAFRYREQKKKGQLAAALFSYFFALLSKEYAITLLALLPLAFYLFGNYSFKKNLLAVLPYIAVAALYLFIRINIVHTDATGAASNIGNDPYAYTTGGAQKAATQIAASFDYLKLLAFPYPLCCDYSYNTIPYKYFSDPVVWLSMLIYLAIIFCFFYFLKKKPAISFAIAFYLLNLALVSNIAFNIGAIMGERLIYHSSVGYAIAVACLLYALLADRGQMGKTALAAIMLSLIVLYGFTTIKRNAEWKNDYTLFFHDLKVAPDNYLIDGNAASAYLRKEETENDEKTKNETLETSKALFDKAISINKEFWSGYINRSYIYFRLNEPDSAVADLDLMKDRYPGFPKLSHMYYNVGVAFYKKAQYPKALSCWQAAVQLDSDYASPQRAINTLKSANLLPE